MAQRSKTTSFLQEEIRKFTENPILATATRASGLAIIPYPAKAFRQPLKRRIPILILEPVEIPTPVAIRHGRGSVGLAATQDACPGMRHQTARARQCAAPDRA